MEFISYFVDIFNNIFFSKVTHWNFSFFCAFTINGNNSFFEIDILFF